jgi:integrase
LTDDELRALLKACTPPPGAEPKVALRHRRDEALIRLMLETGLRAGEAAAGVAGIHPHKLRHTAAHRWLAAGGSESGLMAVAGWTRPDMLMRYTKAQASARAAEEARKLNLGEV